NKSGGFSGSRALTARADLIIEGSDTETPAYETRGRTVRPTLDPIAKPFSINVAHIHDEDDTIAMTTLDWAVSGGGASGKSGGKGKRSSSDYAPTEDELGAVLNAC